MSRLSLTIAILCCALSASVGAQTILFDANERVSVSSEKTLNAGQADLDVTCSITGADFHVDKAFVAKLPYKGGFSYRLAPGSHFLEVSAPGYYDLGIWVLLQEKTLYYVSFRPQRITGFLSIKVEPSDASIYADGSPVSGGLVELPTGAHTMAFRRFGYVEQRLPVVVMGRTTESISIALEKAPFRIGKFEPSRPVFNPRNAGASGRTSLDFSATSYGSARAEIRGPGGEVTATLDFPNIDTWNQSRAWNGLGSDGEPLPDGVYSVTLEATPAPAPDGSPSAEEPIILRTELRLDSNLVIRASGTVSALPGLAYMPDPLTQPAGTLAAEFSWFAPWGGLESSGIGLSAALSLGGIATLAVHAAAETGSPDGASDLAASVLATIFGDRTGIASGAAFVRGSFSSAASTAVPGARTAVEASLPLALRFGAFSAALSPGALVDLSAGGPEFLLLARAGFWLEGRSFRAGVSAELPFSFEGGAPDPTPPLHAALEGRLMLGSTPFVAAAYLGADFEPGAAPRLATGIGLGLLF